MEMIVRALVVRDESTMARIEQALARNRELSVSPDDPAAADVVRVRIGTPSGCVLVVPGTSREVAGRRELTREAVDRLRCAEQMAAQIPVRAVIVSGWSGWEGRGESEASLMARAWRGPDLPLIKDAAARTSAENALCAAELAIAMGDVGSVVIIASWANAIRMAAAARAAFRGSGIRARARVLWGAGHGASLRPGLVGLWWLGRHLRAGRALLTHGPAHPLADTRISRRAAQRLARSQTAG